MHSRAHMPPRSALAASMHARTRPLGLSVCLLACLPACLCACLPACVRACPSIRLSVRLNVCTFLCPSQFLCPDYFSPPTHTFARAHTLSVSWHVCAYKERQTASPPHLLHFLSAPPRNPPLLATHTEAFFVTNLSALREMSAK